MKLKLDMKDQKQTNANITNTQCPLRHCVYQKSSGKLKKMKLHLEVFKDRLIELMLNNDYQSRLLTFIDQLSIEGYTKEDIYKLFLDFHQEIQIDRRTKDNEEVYNQLSDFMDGFTAWGKSFKILPNEPDL